MNTHHWYIAYTRPGRERSVTASLAERSFICFLPEKGMEVQLRQSRITKAQPIFPGYVFFYGSKSDFDRIRKIAGVLSIVHRLNQPAVVSADDIEAIRDFIRVHRNVDLIKIPLVPDTDGTKEGIYGTTVHKQAFQAEVVQLLPSLGYKLSAPYQEEVLRQSVPVKIFKSVRQMVGSINYLYR